MFSHLTKADKYCLPWPKSFLERITPTWGFLSNCIVIEKSILLSTCFKKSVLFAWFYNTFIVPTILWFSQVY